jgi:hypothetical protein
MRRGRVRAVLTRMLTSTGLVIGVIAAFGWVTPAWGALGGDMNSILVDQAQMQGTRKATAMGTYTIHEIQAANGAVVREYQAQGGTVFAVAWSGSLAPDVRQILGNYFDEYTKALKAQSGTPRVRRPITINDAGLAIEMSGHPRWFVGKVYIPEHVPAGLRAEDIR